MSRPGNLAMSWGGYLTRGEFARVLDNLHDRITLSRGEFSRALDDLNERITLMATQADVDAITSQVQTVAADLADARTKLQAEIDGLASANPSIDISGLQAAVAPLDSAAQALGSLTPTPPATPESPDAAPPEESLG